MLRGLYEASCRVHRMSLRGVWMVWDGSSEQETVGFEMTDGVWCPTECHGKLFRDVIWLSGLRSGTELLVIENTTRGSKVTARSVVINGNKLKSVVCTVRVKCVTWWTEYAHWCTYKAITETLRNLSLQICGAHRGISTYTLISIVCIRGYCISACHPSRSKAAVGSIRCVWPRLLTQPSLAINHLLSTGCLHGKRPPDFTS